MHVIGVVGWRNSGKTRLVSALVSEIIDRGFRVSTIKHTHHKVDLDQPGKDTYHHRQAGAHEVLLASSARWALLHERRDEQEPTLDDLLERITPVDLVIVEGFKSWSHDKIEVRRESTDGPVLSATDSTIKALVCEEEMNSAIPLFHPDNIADIADFIVHHFAMRE